MNIDSKIFDKRLAQRIQLYIKRIMCHNHMSFPSRDTRLIQYSKNQCNALNHKLKKETSYDYYQLIQKKHFIKSNIHSSEK